VEKLVKEGKSDTAITQLLNTESQLTVQVLRGKFDREEHPEFGPVPMETGVFSVPDGNQFCVIQVIEVLPAQPKKLDEVRGLATSAYQDQLDKEWLDSLHKKYTVTVNETVLESISQ
jgi:peptidyl-prolyl cis-trans isomerase SurA